MRRRLLIALLVWAALIAAYLRVSGATPETQRGNIIGSFIFVLVVNILAWTPAIAVRWRIAIISAAVAVLGVTSTWRFTRNEFIRDASTYLMYFGWHVAMLVALVGGLLAVVWVIDCAITATVRRRSRDVAVMATLLLFVASCTSSSPAAGVVEKPVVISRTEPSYPEALRKAGISGLVPLEAIIGIDGVPRNVRIIEHEAATTNQELQRIAIETLSAWRFKPAMRDGKPVEQRYVTSIYFKATDN